MTPGEETNHVGTIERDEVAPSVNGDGYISADDALKQAVYDCEEKDVEDVFGGKVRIRGLTAAETARVRQASVNLTNRGADVAWAAAELLQFEYAVIKPKFTKEQVKTLHLTAGPSFTKVIREIDALSGTSEEERRRAQEAFQGTDR